MAHKASLAKGHFPAIEDCLNNILVALKKSILFGALEGRKIETIGEHNLSIVGGNWEGIIGDRLNR